MPDTVKECYTHVENYIEEIERSKIETKNEKNPKNGIKIRRYILGLSDEFRNVADKSHKTVHKNFHFFLFYFFLPPIESKRQNEKTESFFFHFCLFSEWKI